MQDEFDIDSVVGIVLDRWQEMRRQAPRKKADEQFREWVMVTVPTQAGTPPDDHCYIVLEAVNALANVDNAPDAFLLMGWLGAQYAGHDAGVTAPLVMALTDACMQIGDNALAQRTLKDVVAATRRRPESEVQRAVCRAMVHVAYLRGERNAPKDGKMAELRKLWDDVATTYQGSDDPELRGRAAQALWNKVLVALQADEERQARQALEQLTSGFGTDEPEAGEWVVRARHAAGMLERLVIPDAEVNTEYLELQRRNDRKRWWFARLKRGQMPELVRRAREQHRASAGRVRSWVCTGEPFVLLLRNFEMTERSGNAHAQWLPENERHVRVLVFDQTQQVLDELVQGVHLVQVASTTAGELEMTPYPGQFVQPTRLYLPDASWFDTVVSLMAFAERVIVWAAELTGPLERELGELRKQERTGDTLVILQDPQHDPFVETMLPTRKNEQLTADHPILAGFPHVVGAETLAGKRVGECAELMWLVDGLDQARNEPVGQRMQRLLARALQTR